MIKRVLKTIGIIIGAIIICIIGIIVWLWSMSRSYEEDKEYVPISDLSADFVADVNIIRKVTQCDYLPEFEARELWYHRSRAFH